KRLQRYREIKMRVNKLKERKRKSLKRIIWSIVAVVVIGVGLYGLNVYLSLNSALETMHQPIEKSDKREQEVSIAKKDPFSVLLLGVDESENDVGRSDTMIVTSVNPELNTIKMLSIPRDTRTEIIGNGTVEKINH